MRVCIVGASGKLGSYMVEHALDRDYDVVGVCREQSVGKLDAYRERIEIVPGATNDPEVIGARPRGLRRRARGARALGHASLCVRHGAGGPGPRGPGRASGVLVRLVAPSGRQGRLLVEGQGSGQRPGPLGRLARVVDLDDQIEGARRVFASDARWTVVRGSDLEEGPSQGLPVWSRHVGDPILASNRTRRIDFALFMVDALTNDALIHEAPAIVGRETQSALAHADARP